jgi:hypothetical protein
MSFGGCFERGQFGGEFGFESEFAGDVCIAVD